jgi:hypothetical protein
MDEYGDGGGLPYLEEAGESPMRKQRRYLWHGWIRILGGNRPWQVAVSCEEGEDEVRKMQNLHYAVLDQESLGWNVVSSVRLPPDETPTSGGLLNGR